LHTVFESFVNTTKKDQKRFKKREFFVPHHFAQKNGSKSVSFSCHTIFQGKKRFKKREFFVPHHFDKKKRFEKREFSVPRHLAQ
jgi:hypothetical protein